MRSTLFLLAFAFACGPSGGGQTGGGGSDAAVGPAEGDPCFLSEFRNSGIALPEGRCFTSCPAHLRTGFDSEGDGEAICSSDFREPVLDGEPRGWFSFDGGDSPFFCCVP